MPGNGGAQCKSPHLQGCVCATFGAGARKRKRQAPECLPFWRRWLWESWPRLPRTPTWTADYPQKCSLHEQCPEMSKVPCFMPVTVTSGSVSLSTGRSRRPTPAAKPRCRTTAGAQSPVPSVGRRSTTRMSATIRNVFRRSSTPRRPVARATPTRTVARASRNAMAKAKVARASVDEEALTASQTGTRTRTSPKGTPILHQGGTLSPLVGNQTRDLRPVHRCKQNRNKGLSVPTKMRTSQTPPKRSGFMRMARKLQKKGFEVTCPAEF